LGNGLKVIRLIQSLYSFVVLSPRSSQDSLHKKLLRGIFAIFYLFHKIIEKFYYKKADELKQKNCKEYS